MEYIQTVKPETAEMLTGYIKLAAPKKILEIGTGEGQSGILLLTAATNDCTLVTIEKDGETAARARKNFDAAGYGDRVEIINDDAAKVLPDLVGSFDFIFLDGPKGQYINYLPRLVILLSYDGILAADNVLFKGLVLCEEEPPKEYRTIVNNLRRYLKAVKSDTRLKTCVFHTGDGLAVSIKERT